MGTLLQIRQFAQLRSATGNMQGLSPTQWSARATPSRDLTLVVVQAKTSMKGVYIRSDLISIVHQWTLCLQLGPQGSANDYE